MYPAILVIYLSLLRQIASKDTNISTPEPPKAFVTSSLTWPPDLDMTAEMRRENIIPDVISEAPDCAVKIRYGFEGVNFGNNINRIKARPLPAFINWNKEPGHFYTLILTGPDTPTMKDPKYREFQHWIVSNIPARISGPNEGETLTEYKIAAPEFHGDGNHRMVFLMFEQPGKEKLMFDEHRIHTGSPDKLRINFSTRAFVKKYKLKLIGANYFKLDNKLFDIPEDIPLDVPCHTPFC